MTISGNTLTLMAAGVNGNTAGVGMTADQASKVFDPFTQADVTTTRKYGGTGLGLALVRVTLEAHRGTIAVSETPGGGATFAIVFPPVSGS